MKRIVVSLVLLLLSFMPARADKICVSVGPAGDMLCAVNGDNGPNWYVFTGCEDILTIDPPETEIFIQSLSASGSGKYIAILSTSEGHPSLGVYSTSRIDYGEAPELQRVFNPYPGSIANVRWEKEVFYFESNAPLDTVAANDEYLLSQDLQFRFDPVTGSLTRQP